MEYSLFDLKPKRLLTWVDLIILTLIFFGYPIYNSMSLYFASHQAPVAQVGQEPFNTLAFEFDNHANYSTVIFELCALVMIVAYLYIRRFDFKALPFKVNRYTVFITLVLIAISGTIADAFQFTYYQITAPDYAQSLLAGNDSDTLALDSVEADAQANRWQLPHHSLILLALVNGFYEELFFLGIIFAASPTINRHYLMAFSLLVRFAFHTYQGLMLACTVVTLGMVFHYLRAKKISALPPFMLAHAWFDIVGLSFVFWILDKIGFY